MWKVLILVAIVVQEVDQTQCDSLPKQYFSLSVALSPVFHML